MAALTHLDTHVVVWLYLMGTQQISDRATEVLESGDLRISPMVELELAYLREIDRLTVDGSVLVGYLREHLGLRVDAAPFEEVIDVAATLSWTRDPFDRVIAAQAVVAGARLVTRDAAILANLPTAVW